MTDHKEAMIRQTRAQNEVQWTTEPPTGEGFYWVGNKDPERPRWIAAAVTCRGWAEITPDALFYPIRIKEPNEWSAQ